MTTIEEWRALDPKTRRWIRGLIGGQTHFALKRVDAARARGESEERQRRRVEELRALDIAIDILTELGGD